MELLAAGCCRCLVEEEITASCFLIGSKPGDLLELQAGQEHFGVRAVCGGGSTAAVAGE